MNRRQFLVFGAAALASLKTLKTWAAELIKMNTDGSSADPQALALGYVSDAKKAYTKPTDAFIKKANINMTVKKSKKAAPADQLCSKCSFYKGDAKQGTCTILPGKLVHGPGSCNTWVPKA